MVKREEEELSIDFSWLKGISSIKNYSKYGFLILLFILFVISVNIRMQPYDLQLTEDLARNSLDTGITNQIAQQLLAQYPNIDQQTLTAEVQRQKAEFFRQNAAGIEQAVQQQAALIKERFRDDDGTTYLGDIDSYYWLRYARNIDETGNLGERYEDGRIIDDHMVAPIGQEIEPNIYPYLEAYLYKFIKIFKPNANLMLAGFLLPLFLSFFAIVAAFLIGKRLGGDIAGFLAGFLIAVNPMVLSRSLGSDNDIVNAVFPLVVMLFALLALDARDIKRRAAYGVLAGLSLGVYSFAWSGWWFIFLFIIGSSFAYIAYIAFHEYLNSKKPDIVSNKKIKSLLVFVAIFLVSSYLGLALFGNSNTFIESFTNPLRIVRIKEAAKGASLWPNVYTTVAELNAADIPQIISTMGSITLHVLKPFGMPPTIYLFAFALLGTTMFLVNFKSEKHRKTSWAFLLFSAFYFLILQSSLISVFNMFHLFGFLLIGVGFYLYLWNNTGLKGLKRSLFVGSGAAYVAFFIYVLVTSMSSGLAVFTMMGMLFIPLGIGLLLSVLYDYETEPMHSILTLIWVAATIYAATKGVRFILLIIPAFIIAFSVFISTSINFLSSLLARTSSMGKTVSWLLIVSLILIPTMVSIPRISSNNIGYDAGKGTAYQYAPSVSDAWVNSLRKIQAESAPDAIINSWWDFGHWFKYFADRKVTFDGASQNSPQAHWIGKVLLTADEDQAVAILRMLDCGANKAAEEIQKLTNDTEKTVDKVYEYLEAGENAARSDLRKITSDENTEKILGYMFCEPPENYFITSGDMIGKSGVWAHFGSWNFDRAKIYNYYVSLDYDQFISILISDLGKTEEEAKRLYFEISSLTTDREINDWIAPWPGYGGQIGCTAQAEMLYCNIPAGNNQVIPLQINTTSMIAYVESQQGKVYPNKFGYVEDGDIVVTEEQGDKIGYAFLLMPDNSVLFMSEELIDSMFTRLFYLDGLGTEHFEKFYDETSVTGTRIITWKVIWP